VKVSKIKMISQKLVKISEYKVLNRVQLVFETDLEAISTQKSLKKWKKKRLKSYTPVLMTVPKSVHYSI